LGYLPPEKYLWK
jgi:hypothetical protein